MSDDRPRRLGLTDATLLVATAAFSIPALRRCYRPGSTIAGEMADSVARITRPAGPGFSLAVATLVALATPILAIVSLLAATTLVRKYRSGAFASAPAGDWSLATSTLAIYVAFIAYETRWEQYTSLLPPGSRELGRIATGLRALMTIAAGAAVIATWVTLAILRRWRRERTLGDRLGRALGVWWIASAMLAIASAANRGLLANLLGMIDN